MKTCAKCGLEKTNSHFNKDAKAADGLQSWCRSCKKRWEDENLDYGIKYTCVICGSEVFGSDWLCKACYLEQNLQGKSSKDWPDWIRALVKIERRNRYLEQLRSKKVEYLEDKYN